MHPRRSVLLHALVAVVSSLSLTSCEGEWPPHLAYIESGLHVVGSSPVGDNLMPLAVDASVALRLRPDEFSGGTLVIEEIKSSKPSVVAVKQLGDDTIRVTGVRSGSARLTVRDDRGNQTQLDVSVGEPAQVRITPAQLAGVPDETWAAGIVALSGGHAVFGVESMNATNAPMLGPAGGFTLNGRTDATLRSRPVETFARVDIGAMLLQLDSVHTELPFVAEVVDASEVDVLELHVLGQGVVRDGETLVLAPHSELVVVPLPRTATGAVVLGTGPVQASLRSEDSFSWAPTTSAPCPDDDSVCEVDQFVVYSGLGGAADTLTVEVLDLRVVVQLQLEPDDG